MSSIPFWEGNVMAEHSIINPLEVLTTQYNKQPSLDTSSSAVWVCLPPFTVLASDLYRELQAIPSPVFTFFFVA